MKAKQTRPFSHSVHNEQIDFWNQSSVSAKSASDVAFATIANVIFKFGYSDLVLENSFY